MADQQFSIDDLQYLMSRLRDPVDGCPWDKQQTFSSIVPHTLEESYELADAISHGDMAQIKEELGDVLFQVVFYAQLGREQQAFDFDAIVSQLTAKLIRRHPHVFPEGHIKSRVGQQTTNTELTAEATQKIKDTWETIKTAERKQKQQLSVLDDVPVALPATTRAIKLQKRAARVGFDWPNIDPVLDKIHEELGELLEARKSGNRSEEEAELGDLLFSCVNLARHLKIDPESALRATNNKFEQRFRYIEAQVNAKGCGIESVSLQNLDQLWEEAKESGL